MEQHTANPAISLRDALRLGLAEMWRHREAACLLAALYALLLIADVLINPQLLTIFGHGAAAPEYEKQLQEISVSFWLTIGIMLIANAAVSIIWVRLSMLGAGAAFAGGWAALYQRATWVAWRTLCGSGWLMLVLLMLFLPLSLLGPGFQPGSSLTPINIIQLAIIFAVVALATSVIGVAIITQALDHPLTIRTVFLRLMGSGLWPAAGCWVVTFSVGAIATKILALVLFNVVDPAPPASFTLHLDIALSAFIDKLAVFVWLSSLAAYARRVMAAEAQGA